MKPKQYYGFHIQICPNYESTESRLRRGDWRAVIVGYSYSVRYRGKACFQSNGFSSCEQAYQDAENRIDAILDSL